MSQIVIVAAVVAYTAFLFLVAWRADCVAPIETPVARTT